MALQAESVDHLRQIQAGMKGRNKGHEFELKIANSINKIDWARVSKNKVEVTSTIYRGEPSSLLVDYILNFSGFSGKVEKVIALSLGAIATAEKHLKTSIDQ